MEVNVSRLPLSLYPTAAQDRLTEGSVADIFKEDVRHVRAMNAFTRDLLVSRAIERGYIARDWAAKSHLYSVMLEELSRAILGHWSKLLTEVEREERRHVLFVLRVMRSRYQPISKGTNRAV